MSNLAPAGASALQYLNVYEDDPYEDIIDMEGLAEDVENEGEGGAEGEIDIPSSGRPSASRDSTPTYLRAGEHFQTTTIPPPRNPAARWCPSPTPEPMHISATQRDLSPMIWRGSTPSDMQLQPSTDNPPFLPSSTPSNVLALPFDPMDVDDPKSPRHEPMDVDEELKSPPTENQEMYVDDVVPTSHRAGKYASQKFHRLPTEKEIRDFIKLVETSKEQVQFRRQQLKAKDLKRFVNGMANDEILNFFIAVFNCNPSDNDSGPHFGDLFDLDMPASDSITMSTFFYPKLVELLSADAKTAESTTEHLSRWFNAEELANKRSVFIPVHDRERVHWLLAEIDYTHQRLRLYDSWAENLKDWQSRGTSDKPYSKLIRCLRLATGILSRASNEAIKMDTNHNWIVDVVRIPHQSNGTDCGFFVIMVLLHHVFWGEVESIDTPPYLRISGQMMKKDTRLLLAWSAIQWSMLHSPQLGTFLSQEGSSAEPIQILSPSPPPMLSARGGQAQPVIDLTIGEYDNPTDEDSGTTLLAPPSPSPSRSPTPIPSGRQDEGTAPPSPSPSRSPTPIPSGRQDEGTAPPSPSPSPSPTPIPSGRQDEGTAPFSPRPSRSPTPIPSDEGTAPSSPSPSRTPTPIPSGRKDKGKGSALRFLDLDAEDSDDEHFDDEDEDEGGTFDKDFIDDTDYDTPHHVYAPRMLTEEELVEYQPREPVQKYHRELQLETVHEQSQHDDDSSSDELRRLKVRIQRAERISTGWARAKAMTLKLERLNTRIEQLQETLASIPEESIQANQRRQDIVRHIDLHGNQMADLRQQRSELVEVLARLNQEVRQDPLTEPDMAKWQQLEEKRKDRELRVLIKETRRIEEPRLGEPPARNPRGLSDEALARLPDSRVAIMAEASSGVFQWPEGAPTFKRTQQLEGMPVRRGEWVCIKRTDDGARTVAFALGSDTFVVPRTLREKLDDACEQIQFPEPLLQKSAPVIHPTSEELVPFKQSRLRSLRRPCGRTSFAPTAGDRVVGLEAPVKGVDSVIERLVKGSNNEDLAILPGMNAVPVAILHRHFLDPGPPPQICDRVRVVRGPHRDTLGLIVTIDGHTLELESLLTSCDLLRVNIEDTVREFFAGDLVEILDGDASGEQLIVVAVNSGERLTVVRGTGKETERLDVRPSDVRTVHEGMGTSAVWTRPSVSGPAPLPVDGPDKRYDDALTEQTALLVTQAKITLFSELGMPYSEAVSLAEPQYGQRGVPAAQMRFMSQIELNQYLDLVAQVAKRWPKKAEALHHAEVALKHLDLTKAQDKLKVLAGLQHESDQQVFERLCVAFDTELRARTLSLARKQAEELERLNNQWMGHGLRFKDMEVMVLVQDSMGNMRRGVDKGLKGTVIGDNDSAARRARELNGSYWRSHKDRSRYYRQDLDGIELTIAFDSGQVLQKVPIDRVVEFHTKTPLKDAVYVHRTSLHNRRYEIKPPPPTSLPPPRSVTPPPPSDGGSDEITTQIEGEATGHWFCRPQFVGKRIDVELVGLTSDRYDRGTLKTSERMRRHEGQVGHLLLLEPYDAATLKKQPVPVSGFRGRIKFPGPCIRPSRTTNDGRPVTKAVHERVIIIGPDVKMDLSWLGSYAEVLPDVPADRNNVIFIDGSRGQYPLSSLCLSRNEKIVFKDDKDIQHIFDSTVFPTV